jgi:hypothetical protein
MIALVEPLPGPSQIVSVRTGWVGSVSKIICFTDTQPSVDQHKNVATQQFSASPCALIYAEWAFDKIIEWRSLHPPRLTNSVK